MSSIFDSQKEDKKMSLWPGYYINKFEAIPDPIIDEIPVFQIDPMQEPSSEQKTTGGTYYGFKNSGKVSANGFVLMEQFGSGTMSFMYYFDEWHWILLGEMDVTYSLSSTSHTVKKTVHVGPGDFIITPRGSIVEWKCKEGEWCRRYCGMMPGYALHPRIHEMMKKMKAEQEAKEGK